jgi:hypothetical protein
MGAMADGESDDFKRILLEGNPVLLGVTFAVSMLHSVFDMLAFKNDIGFWKNKKNVEGLSVRTILINCVCQARPRRRPGSPARTLVCGDAHGVALCLSAGGRAAVLQAMHCRQLLGNLPVTLEDCVLWAIGLTVRPAQGDAGEATSAAAPAQRRLGARPAARPGVGGPDAASDSRARASWSSSCTCWTTTPATSCSSAAASAC